MTDNQLLHMLMNKVDNLAEKVHKSNGIKELVNSNAEGIKENKETIADIGDNLTKHCASVEAVARQKGSSFGKVATIVSLIIGFGGVAVAILALL